MKKNGFSLVELVIVVAIASIVMLATARGMTSIYQYYRATANDVELHSSANLVFRSIDKSFQNTLRFVPGDGLSQPSSPNYTGISDTLLLESCDLSAPNAFQGVSWTSIVGRETPGVLLRAWSESDIANGESARISATSGQTTMFPSGNNFQEVSIIDGDNYVVARFKVTGHSNIESTLSPYDDSPTLPPVTTPYVKLDLALPTNPLGAEVRLAKLKLISNSIVYPTQTQTLCSNSERDLILFNHTRGTQRLILPGKLGKSELTKLEFQFQMMTAAGPTVTTSLPTEERDKSCVTAIIVIIEIRTLRDNIEQIDVFKRSFPLPNFSERIPIHCTS